MVSVEIGEDHSDVSYSERVELVRASLADICLRDYRERFGFYRVLNRMIILFQEPLCFAICYRSQDEYGYTIDRNTIRDPLFESQFEACIKRELGYSEDTKTIPEDVAKEFLVPIFKTDYFIISFRVERDPNAQFSKQVVQYRPIKVSDPIGSVLADVFDQFGRSLRRLGVQKVLQENFAKLFDVSSYMAAIADDPRKEDCAATDLDRSVIALYARGKEEQLGSPSCKTVEDVLETETDLILGSPLLVAHDAYVSNLLVVRKCFDRENVRFGSYFYGIHAFLSKRQKEQFSSSLSRFTMEERDNFIPFPNVRGDAKYRLWFWKKVDEGDTQELLAILESPLSRGARLFPEYVLMSGAAIINIDPFSRGDIGWMDEGLAPEDADNEFKRFVVLHYLLQMMAPGVAKPSLLTLPLRVSGATWMTATVVVSGEVDSASSGCVAPSEEFIKRYFMYHSLMRDLETRLRRKTKDTYVEAVYDVFVRHLREQAGPGLGAGKGVKLELSDYRKINAKLTALARLYPFDMIHLGSLEDGPQAYQEYDVESLGSACNTAIGVYDGNPFYDRLKLQNFLTREDVGKRLRGFVNAELGLGQARRDQTLKLVV